MFVCSDLGVNFGLWFIFATPAMILALALSWLYLSAIYCDDRYVTAWLISVSRNDISHVSNIRSTGPLSWLHDFVDFHD